MVIEQGSHRLRVALIRLLTRLVLEGHIGNNTHQKFAQEANGIEQEAAVALFLNGAAVAVVVIVIVVAVVVAIAVIAVVLVAEIAVIAVVVVVVIVIAVVV